MKISAAGDFGDIHFSDAGYFAVRFHFPCRGYAEGFPISNLFGSGKIFSCDNERVVFKGYTDRGFDVKFNPVGIDCRFDALTCELDVQKEFRLIK